MEGSGSSQNQEDFWEVWNQVFTFKLLCNVIGVIWDVLSCFVAKLWLDREVLKTKPMSLDAQKIFESKTVPLRLQKVVKMEAIFRWLRVSFLKKWTFFHFPSLKNDFGVEQCSSYYQLIALLIRNSKHIHNFFIGSLDHSRFGFEVACWLL